VVSDWQPGASIRNLQRRAQVMSLVRNFFANESVMEVDVPVLSRSGVTDLNIDGICATLAGAPAYLQTSPEYFMKRLLASGSGDIYCLGKAFRDSEIGHKHNPEFALLEWYRCGWDEHQLMSELGDLVSQLMNKPGVSDLRVTKVSYADCFKDKFGLNPHQASLSDLQGLAAKAGSLSWAGETRANCLDLIFSLKIEPQLPEGLVFIYDYPECQAALAAITTIEQGYKVSRRFEGFLDGLEIANGYFELCDPVEQRCRFDQDNIARQAAGKPIWDIDTKLLDAMRSGLPACSGVALGLDRLLMSDLEVQSIDQVMPFSWMRC
jgi:lysyl-tRNA synthetase class 2|tara:strand:- start:569 stop:1534 length:966 start_codon:yes stop_codon:yes gene_type:complete